MVLDINGLRRMLQVQATGVVGPNGQSACSLQLSPAARQLSHLCTAPCSRTSAWTISVIARCTSASVSVRSAAWNVSRYDRLTRPSGTPLPWYRSNSRMRTSVGGAAARMVPRTIAAGKVSSTMIEMSRTTDGCRGGGTELSMPGAGDAIGDRVEVDFGDVDLVLRGDVARRRQRRRELADHADRSRAGLADSATDRGVGRGTRNGRSRGASTRRRRRARDPISSTTPLMSKKSTARRAAAPVPGVAAPTHASAERPALAAAVAKTRAQLEQPHVVLPAAAVVGDRIDQPGQQRRPQHRELLRERVQDLDDLRLRRRTSAAASRAMNEKVTRFGEAGRRGEAPHEPVALEPAIRFRGRRRRAPGTSSAGGRTRSAARSPR